MKFYTIHTSVNQTISVTENHLIMKYFAENKETHMVVASQLEVNDFLLFMDRGTNEIKLTRVMNIEIENKIGFITVMTNTGSLFVNDILTSCYVDEKSTPLKMHTALYPFRFYYHLLKHKFGLKIDPFTSEMQVKTYQNPDEFYGHQLVLRLHQLRHLIRYSAYDLVFNIIFNV